MDTPTTLTAEQRDALLAELVTARLGHDAASNSNDVGPTLSESLTAALDEVAVLRERLKGSGIASVSSRAEQAESELRATKAELAAVQAARATAENALAELRTGLAGAVQAEVQTLRVEVAALRTERDELQARAEKAEADLVPLNIAVARVMAQVGQPMPVSHDADGQLGPSAFGMSRGRNVTEACRDARSSAAGRGTKPPIAR